jgi:hypothetical protein
VLECGLDASGLFGALALAGLLTELLSLFQPCEGFLLLGKA